MKTGEPVESLSLLTRLVLLMRKFNNSTITLLGGLHYLIRHSSRKSLHDALSACALM